MSSLQFDILLIDDNPGDARLTIEAFKASKRLCRFHVIENGLDAMEALRQRGAHRDFPRPHLILLDLNIPEKDGREILKEIKEDDQLRGIPVIVLTGSEAEEDIQRAYHLKANCYVAKPSDLSAFEKVVQEIQSFWLSTVSLPQG